jgi:hypothetical protein
LGTGYRGEKKGEAIACRGLSGIVGMTNANEAQVSSKVVGTLYNFGQLRRSGPCCNAGMKQKY